MMTRMTNCEDIRNFCRAGRAHLVLKSLDTMKGMKYRVTEVEEPRGCDSLYFVGYWYLEQYIYIGVIRNNHFEHTQKSLVEQTDVIFQVFSMFWRELIEKNRLDPQVEFYHKNYCGRCGQPLVSGKELDKGIGTCCQSYLDSLYVEHSAKKGRGKDKQLRLFDN